MVSGGSGFIGSHIAEEIVRQGKEVIVLDNTFRPKNFRGWWDKKLCTFIEADVRDLKAIRPHFEGVDVVFHEACSKCTVCRDNPVADLMVNALGSYNVFEAARREGVKKIVHASTGSVNGGAPRSFYGVSKQAGESYLRAFSEYYPSFRFTAIRYHHVFGARQNGDTGTGGVVPIFIKQMLNGGNITVFGDGEQQRHFTYVKDVVDFNFRCETEFDGKFVTLAEHTPTTINQLTRAIGKVIGKDPVVSFQPAKAGDIRFFNVDDSPMPLLGDDDYDARFDENLRKTVEYYASAQA